MSESKHSSGSVFLHDLIAVDWSKVDIYTAVRAATIVAPLLLLGVIIGQVGASTLVIIGAAWVLIVDEILPTELND